MQHNTAKCCVQQGNTPCPVFLALCLATLAWPQLDFQSHIIKLAVQNNQG